MLRNRLDSWDYDIDELFLGTMLFTLVIFLFPTFAAYYFFLALVSWPCHRSRSLHHTLQMQLAVIIAHALIDVLLAFLNHFPLGALMLRLKDSERLPGGWHYQSETYIDFSL